MKYFILLRMKRDGMMILDSLLNRHIKTLKQPWNNRINFLKVINKGKNVKIRK